MASARKLIGATNPLNAEPGTIRGDLAGEQCKLLDSFASLTIFDFPMKYDCAEECETFLIYPFPCLRFMLQSKPAAMSSMGVTAQRTVNARQVCIF